MASSLASQSLHRHTLWQLFRCMVVVVIGMQLTACSSNRYIARQAKATILSDSNLTTAHIGISIYDASANKYLYNYQGNKYFIPASNTKLFTCYAAMKHLGDSLPGLRYQNDSVLVFKGTGDPTLLHTDFRQQPVLDFLKKSEKPLVLSPAAFKTGRWNSGWSVGDINEDYMVERNELPIYGNILRIYRIGDSIETYPRLYRDNVRNPIARNWNITFERWMNENIFEAVKATAPFTTQDVPFGTGNYMSPWILLMDTLKKDIALLRHTPDLPWQTIYSQPTDSLLKPMMHRSDNFYAEQALLMVSNEMTGTMNDEKIIDSLLKTDYKDLPQKPRWVDGSGLSRYNLFSPQDFVTVLDKMKNEFNWNRITTILPTGGEGTLNNYYINLKDRIFAKTGTLSNNVALSGFLLSKHHKILIFSVIVNNHMGSTAKIRRVVEKFLTALAEKY